jgi:hypothetical protein
MTASGTTKARRYDELIEKGDDAFEGSLKM